MPLTVAGQWRIYTAFPSIPRLKKYSRAEGAGSQGVGEGDYLTQLGITYA